MKRKKITGICLSFLLAISAFVPSTVTSIHAAGSKAQSEAVRWFKDQLNDQEKLFYQAMVGLYNNGELESGTASVDMTTMGITKAQIEAYLNGDTALAQAFHNAKDAFFYDYGDVFYVNPEKLTLRTGRKSDGTYVMTLGKGSNENYYAEGFTSKEQVNKAKEDVANASSAILANVSSIASDKEKLKAIHDGLINKVTYKYPTQASTEELPYLDSIYGALVKGTAQCGGYSKAYRYLLNELGYSNVLIYGVRDYGEENKDAPYEEHMWNMVKLGDRWFAVDTTWDDPIGGSLRDTYFLKGSSNFDADHLEKGQVSAEGKVFTYPELNIDDYDQLPVEPEENINGLKVDRYKDVQGSDNLSSYKVTYNGLTEEEAAAEGMSYAFRISAGADTSTWGDWMPISAHVAENNGIATKLAKTEGGGYLVFTAHKGYIQFLVTKAKAGTEDNPFVFENQADSDEYKVQISDPVEIDTFVESNARPFIVSGSPQPSATLRLQDQWIEVETDERLEKIDSAKDISIELTNTQQLMNANVSKVSYEDSSYVNANGTRILNTKVRFYFVPDKTFQSEINTYTFTIKNMRGIYTKKEPNSVRYRTSFPIEVPCPLRKYSKIPTAKVVGEPILVADDKLDAFTTDGGTSLSSLHVQLVASRPGSDLQENLNDSLAGALGGVTPKASSTYDITLSCSNIVAAIRPGYKVMIGLPYPEGYDYRTDQNVVFKAYHFKLNKSTGKYEPEELICQITPAGLMVMAESFSPFSVVAFDKKDVTEDNSVKTTMVTLNSDGGSVLTQVGGQQSSAVGIHSLKKNEKKQIQVKADEGYVIEKILIDGKVVKLDANATSYTQNFNFDDMKTDSSMEVYFVAKSTKAEEASKGITPLLPEVEGEKADPTPTPNPDPVPTPDPTPDSGSETVTYKKQSLTDKATGIVVAGKLKEGVRVIIKKDVDDKAGAAFLKVAGSDVLLNAFDVSLSSKDGFEGKLKLTFPVDKKYEGRIINVLHYVNGKVETTAVQVNNASVSIEVDSLSPFALVLTKEKTSDEGKGSATVTPDNQTQHDDKTNSGDKTDTKKKSDVDTGDHSISPFWYVGAMICCAGILIIVKKKRDAQANEE